MDVATSQVEVFLAGTACDPRATPIVEEVLFNHALKHSIVYAGRAIKRALEDKGYSVLLQYCDSPAHGHPLPFITARDASGKFVIPTELDIRDALRAVDVIVVDGTTKLTKIAKRKPHLQVYSRARSGNRRTRPLPPMKGRKTAADAHGYPAALVVMPAVS